MFALDRFLYYYGGLDNRHVGVLNTYHDHDLSGHKEFPCNVKVGVLPF